MKKDVFVLTGAGSIGIAIARRVGIGKHIVLADFNIENAKREINLLKKYLPEQLSEEDVIKIVDDIILEVKPTGIKDMGKIMKEVTPKVKGRYDMAKVSTLIKSKLQ